MTSMACQGTLLEPDGTGSGNGNGSGAGAGAGGGGGNGGSTPGWTPGNPLPPPGQDVPPEQQVPPPADPGTLTLRRLNRVEYNNTVRDLLETNLRPADNFPDDDIHYGFDTIGSTLSISPLHLEMYERAADQLIEELFADPATSARRRRLLPCDVAANLTCARDVIGAFAKKAFRRPVTAAEIDSLAALIGKAQAAGATQEQGVKVALKAVLMSPHFVYRVEIDTDPEGTTPRRLSNHELASRLSYFLWSTTPDDELLKAADDGRLQEDGVLETQIARLLDSPKAASLVANFAGQWLFTRSIEKHELDSKAFPNFDAALKSAMRQETERFFEALLKEQRLIGELLTADFSFLNGRLATHYGLPAPGQEFGQTSLSGSERRGLLTQGTFLTLTSVPTRTSPVKRGKWVLEQLLCSPPKPPPPGVEGLDEGPGVPGTLRERLEQHRKDPVCASCHTKMDPIGLGLENFDAVGAYRTMDNGQPIVAAGELPGPVTFSSAKELAAIIAKDSRFDACITQQLVNYGVGRGLKTQDTDAYAARDKQWIAHLTQQARIRGGTVRDTIETVVKSELFRSRRGGSE
jgi:hypothetical protein